MKHETKADATPFCPFCGKYKVFKNGRCYQCNLIHLEAIGDAQRERETIERLRDRSFCED
jgi:hypothetical protein